jgi:hypothetical protein
MVPPTAACRRSRSCRIARNQTSRTPTALHGRPGGCVLTALCNRPSRAYQRQWGRKEAAQTRCSASGIGSTPQDLIPNGMHPIGLAPGSQAPSVSAGQGPILWAWLDLNQRPHPYQVSRAKRCADRRFPRSLATVRGEGMRSRWIRSQRCRQARLAHTPIGGSSISPTAVVEAWPADAGDQHDRTE